MSKRPFFFIVQPQQAVSRVSSWLVPNSKTFGLTSLFSFPFFALKKFNNFKKLFKIVHINLLGVFLTVHKESGQSRSFTASRNGMHVQHERASFPNS